MDSTKPPKEAFSHSSRQLSHLIQCTYVYVIPTGTVSFSRSNNSSRPGHIRLPVVTCWPSPSLGPRRRTTRTRREANPPLAPPRGPGRLRSGAWQPRSWKCGRTTPPTASSPSICPCRKSCRDFCPSAKTFLCKIITMYSIYGWTLSRHNIKCK